MSVRNTKNIRWAREETMEIALWLSQDRPNENQDDPDAASETNYEWYHRSPKDGAVFRSMLEWSDLLTHQKRYHLRAAMIDEKEYLLRTSTKVRSMNQLYMKLFTMLANGTATNETVTGNRLRNYMTLPACVMRRCPFFELMRIAHRHAPLWTAQDEQQEQLQDNTRDISSDVELPINAASSSQRAQAVPAHPSHASAAGNAVITEMQAAGLAQGGPQTAGQAEAARAYSSSVVEDDVESDLEGSGSEVYSEDAEEDAEDSQEGFSDSDEGSESQSCSESYEESYEDVLPVPKRQKGSGSIPTASKDPTPFQTRLADAASSRDRTRNAQNRPRKLPAKSTARTAINASGANGSRSEIQTGMPVERWRLEVQEQMTTQDSGYEEMMAQQEKWFKKLSDSQRKWQFKMEARQLEQFEALVLLQQSCSTSMLDWKMLDYATRR